MGSMGRVFHLFSSSKVLRLLLKKYTSIFLSSRCPSDKYHRYIYPLYLSLLPESILLESRKEAKFHTRLPFSLQPPTSLRNVLFSLPLFFSICWANGHPRRFIVRRSTLTSKKCQKPKSNDLNSPAVAPAVLSRRDHPQLL